MLMTAKSTTDDAGCMAFSEDSKVGLAVRQSFVKKSSLDLLSVTLSGHINTYHVDVSNRTQN
jgi:hypothetical protein